MDEISTKKTLQVLHFLTQNVHACIELNYVKKVIPLTLLERVPGSPVHVVGLLNLAGKSIPVIDLALRLGLNRNKKYSLDLPIVICSDDQFQIGMIVDRILGLEVIDQSSFQLREEFEQDDSLFLAVVTINSDLSLLINMDFILASRFKHKNEEQVVNEDLMNMVTVKYD